MFTKKVTNVCQEAYSPPIRPSSHRKGYLFPVIWDISLWQVYQPTWGCPGFKLLLPQHLLLCSSITPLISFWNFLPFPKSYLYAASYTTFPCLISPQATCPISPSVILGLYVLIFLAYQKELPSKNYRFLKPFCASLMLSLLSVSSILEVLQLLCAVLGFSLAFQLPLDSFRNSFQQSSLETLPLFLQT